MASSFRETAHWRDSARTARFYMVDANASFPLLLFLVHMKFWTFMLALLFMVFFTVVARFGFTVPVFFRWFRLTLAGPRKYAVPWWKE